MPTANAEGRIESEGGAGNVSVRYVFRCRQIDTYSRRSPSACSELFEKKNRFPFLLCCRLMVGFGLGGMVVAFSLFSEFVPNAVRGTTIIAAQGVFWSLGAASNALLAWWLIPS